MRDDGWRTGATTAVFLVAEIGIAFPAETVNGVILGDRFGGVLGDRFGVVLGDRFGVVLGDRFGVVLGDRFGVVLGDRFGVVLGDRFGVVLGERFGEPACSSSKIVAWAVVAEMKLWRLSRGRMACGVVRRGVVPRRTGVTGGRSLSNSSGLSWWPNDTRLALADSMDMLGVRDGIKRPATLQSHHHKSAAKLK